MPTDPIHFPYLDNGMLSQMPVRLELNRIAPANRFLDGSILYAASDAKLQYNWTLRYDDLSEAEWQRFTDFFAAIATGSEAFTFYDPLGNLLADTGNLESSSWIRPAGLALQSFSDPDVDKAYIVTNPTSAPLVLSQAVNVAGGFQTSFSLLVRWAGGMPFALAQSDGAQRLEQHFQATGWTRHFVAMKGVTSSASRSAEIVVLPTTQLIIAAPQLEIAAAPNAYSETGGHGGVFPQAWIGQKKLELQSPTPGGHSITLQIESLRQS
ncbi:hypothetical protein [Bryobacter aggregatus]|uniref:hypothetical protein n=1 Tax=Bryobacter aggregatus TaxID=360054 RepID=UPI0004E1F514|nr:hypothetical protein [Bryobacter aggregatus]